MSLVSLIRKTASIERGRRTVENLGSVEPVAVVRMHKAAQADRDLMKIAAWCEGDALSNYEALGGNKDSSR